eukprot:12422834-Ditylum_brightwellii.AAC.1
MTLTALRLISDTARILSVLLMIRRLRFKRNGNNVSIKTQEFFCIVYLTRYSADSADFDLNYSLYNAFIIIFCITSSIYILYLSDNVRYNAPLNKNEDISRHSFILVPSAIAAYVHLKFFNPGTHHPPEAM